MRRVPIKYFRSKSSSSSASTLSASISSKSSSATDWLPLLASTAAATSLILLSDEIDNDNTTPNNNKDDDNKKRNDNDEDNNQIQQRRRQSIERPRSLFPDNIFPGINFPLPIVPSSSFASSSAIVSSLMDLGNSLDAYIAPFYPFESLSSFSSLSSSPFYYSQCEQQQQQQQQQLYPQPLQSQQTSRKRAAIRKFRTVRELGRNATKAQLETKYIWDKKKVLGTGAYGSVFLATDRATKEPVALKEIPKTLTDSVNFQQEMTAMMYINKHGSHPHLCRLHEHFDYPEHYYIILDYIGGGELFDHLIQNGAYSELDASRLVREVASALNFLHGIGVVHADLKPENILLSSTRRGDAVIKLCDFGCAQITHKLDDEDEEYRPTYGAPTPAYCPPETILKEKPISPSSDMWGLGIILFIMLTGAHPYDVDGDASDEEIERRITDPEYEIPLNNADIAGHLSDSAKDLISKLMERDSDKRLTAMEMLQHPWVCGETAATDIMQGSDNRLSKYRVFKSKLQAHFFQSAINWSDEEMTDKSGRTVNSSLVLRSFKSLDEKNKGHLTSKEILGTNSKGGPKVNLTDFTNLVHNNIKHQHFPPGHVVYKEGDPGHHMYIIESGTIEVITNDGSKATRGPGEFFGDGALLNPGGKRSATVVCKTPIHALEVDRENFDKYVASSDNALLLTLKEKDKIRKRNRARTILAQQKDLKIVEKKKGEIFFQIGEPGKAVYVLDKGKVDVVIDGRTVFSAFPGNIFGEFSLFSGLPRNCTAVCSTPEGCIAKEMDAKKFKKVLEQSPLVRASLKELQLRREFKKAVVVRLGKEFPYENPREAFNAADKNGMGILDRESVADLMRELKNDYCDDEIDEIIRTLNLTDSGLVTFDEFKKVFIGNIKTADSM